MPIDWPTIVAFVVVEAAFVLLAAPILIQRKNEERAVVVFKEKLLPLMPKVPAVPTAEDLARAVEVQLHRFAPPTPTDIATAVRDAIPVPSPEDQQAARAQLAEAFAAQVQATVPGAIQAAIAEAVKGRMGALSAQAGDARATKALQENQLKARVGEKYGLKGLGALKVLQMADKDLYQLGLDAVAFAPGSLDEWLDQHADKFTIGTGGAAGKRITVV